MVMVAPGGVASLVLANLRLAAFGGCAPSPGCMRRSRPPAPAALARGERDDRDALPPADRHRPGAGDAIRAIELDAGGAPRVGS
jgi:hypothetical protein